MKLKYEHFDTKYAYTAILTTLISCKLLVSFTFRQNFCQFVIIFAARAYY